jgi:hypothetical protein
LSIIVGSSLGTNFSAPVGIRLSTRHHA